MMKSILVISYGLSGGVITPSLSHCHLIFVIIPSPKCACVLCFLTTKHMNEIMIISYFLIFLASLTKL